MQCGGCKIGFSRQGWWADRIVREFCGIARNGWLIEDFGGPGRVRTDDLFHAMEARSQLRHRPLIPQ